MVECVWMLFSFHWKRILFCSEHSESLSTEQIQEILSISPRFSRLKNLKEWQQETEQELVQASRAQWLYGYEIQHFLCKAFSEEWQCQAPTMPPHYFHPRMGLAPVPGSHQRTAILFSEATRLIVPASQKRRIRDWVSCVNHNLSLIPSYKTWTHNSQTDTRLRLRPR